MVHDRTRLGQALASTVALAMEFGAFLAADRGDHARAWVAGGIDAGLSRRAVARVEPQVELQEIGAAPRVARSYSPLIDTPPLTRSTGRSSPHVAPLRAQHHRGQVTAGRVAAGDDARPVELVARGVAVQPGMRGQGLAHDRVESGVRRQRVVRNRHADAGGDQRRRDPREIALVERAPVAAVQEHEQWRVRRGCGKEVEPLGRRRSVGKVVETRAAPPHRRRFVGPALQDRGCVGDRRAGVVLAIECGGAEMHGRGGGCHRSGRAGRSGSEVAKHLRKCRCPGRIGASRAASVSRPGSGEWMYNPPLLGR